MQVYTSNYFKYKGERGVQISNSKPKDINVSGVLPVLFPDWNEVERWNKVKDIFVTGTQLKIFLIRE